MSRFYQDPSAVRRSVIRKTSFFSLLVAFIIFGLGLNGREPLSGVKSKSEDVSSRILTVLSMPARGAEKISRDLSGFFDLADENKRLREEILRLSQVEIRDMALQEQVAYLEAVLKTDIKLGIEDAHITARAVSENNGPFVKSALVNSGQKQGVEKGLAVLTDDGLYGRVVRSGRVSSRVLLLNDLSSRVPVMSLRSRSRAILSGTNGDTPELDFRGDGDWQIGDRVITSGDDGALPRGVPIGIVVGVKADTIGVSLYTDRAPVDWVRIMPFNRIAAPESDPAIITQPAVEGDVQAAQGAQGAIEAAGQNNAPTVTPQTPELAQ